MNRNSLPSLMMALCLTAGASHLSAEDANTPAPPKWESSAFLGLTLTRGNSDTVLVSGNVKTAKKDGQNEWAFGANGSYGENDSVRNNEMLYGFGQYNRLFSERLFGYLRADGLYDGIAEVDYRFTVGPGLGYYLIKKEATSLALEFGPGMVFEKRGGQTDCYATLRLAERFEHKFSDRARMWQSAEILPEVSDFENYVINAEIGVAASISANMELSVVLQDTYVSQPAAGRKHNDVKLLSGITYKF